MKHRRVGLIAAAVSLVLFVPEIALSQQNAQKTNPSASAGAEAANMVRGQAAMDKTIDARSVQPGDKITAKLSSKVRLKNGTELPAGTELIGKIGTDDMQQNGTSKLALLLDQAQTKDGKTIPLKTTIVAVYGPGASSPGNYPVAAGDQVPNDWTRSIYQVDQVGALSGVDLHSSVTSQNSGVLVSTKKDDFKLKRGTEFALAIAPRQPGEQSANMH